MSTRTNLLKAVELVASLSLKNPAVTCDAFACRMIVEPFELVRIYNVLSVQRSRVTTHQTESYLHIAFRARGAEFVALIARDDSEAFFSKLTGKPLPKLESRRAGLPAPEVAK